MRIGALMILLCAALRYNPLTWYLMEYGYYENNVLVRRFVIFFLHVGQILNAASGVFVMSVPPMVSALWFPEKERALATTIGVCSNGVGTMVGYPLGIWAYHFGGMSFLLSLTGVIGFAVGLVAIVTFPAVPRNPCCALAEKHKALQLTQGNKSQRGVNRVDEHLNPLPGSTSIEMAVLPSSSSAGSGDSREFNCATASRSKAKKMKI